MSRKGRREYLNNVKTREFIVLSDDFFDSLIAVPRRGYGNR